MRVTIAGSPHSVKPRTAPGSPPRAAATATTICPRESGRKQQRNTPASSRRRRPRARADVDARREPVRRPRRAVSAPRNRSLRVNPAGGHAGDFRATSPTGGLHMRTRAREGLAAKHVRERDAGRLPLKAEGQRIGERSAGGAMTTMTARRRSMQFAAIGDDDRKARRLSPPACSSGPAARGRARGARGTRRRSASRAARRSGCAAVRCAPACRPDRQNRRRRRTQQHRAKTGERDAGSSAQSHVTPTEARHRYGARAGAKISLAVPRFPKIRRAGRARRRGFFDPPGAPRGWAGRAHRSARSHWRGRVLWGIADPHRATPRTWGPPNAMNPSGAKLVTISQSSSLIVAGDAFAPTAP